MHSELMEPTTVTNTTAQSHPFVCGQRTFATQAEATDFAGRAAQRFSLSTFVRDRRTSRTVASFPIGVK